MPEISIDVEIYCSCGEGLCRQSTAGNNRYSNYITVEPCEKCLDRARDEQGRKSYDEGYADKEKELDKAESTQEKG